MNVINPNYNMLFLTNRDDDQIWVKQKPKYADHIRVWRSIFYAHHGIFVSENEIIHFASKDGDNLSGSGNIINKTTLKEFLKDGELEVKKYNSKEISQLNPPDIVVKRARSLVGNDKYNIVFNNSEHLSNYCTLDKHRSSQVEKVILDYFKNRKNSWILY